MSLVLHVSRWTVFPQGWPDTYSSRRNTDAEFSTANTGFQHSNVRFKLATRNDLREASLAKARFLLVVSLQIGLRGVWWSNSSSRHRTTRWRPLFRKLNFNRYPVGESGIAGNESQIVTLLAQLLAVHSFRRENLFRHECSKKSNLQVKSQFSVLTQ
jgi:hypothetical protein